MENMYRPSKDIAIHRDITRKPLGRKLHAVMVYAYSIGSENFQSNYQRKSRILEIASYGTFRDGLPDFAMGYLNGSPVKVVANFYRCVIEGPKEVFLVHCGPLLDSFMFDPTNNEIWKARRNRTTDRPLKNSLVSKVPCHE